MPDDAQYVLSNAEHVHGFYGASSMERLPVEEALTEQTRRFKDLRPRTPGGPTPRDARQGP
jgi:predicted TIM-barrel enzyme